MIERYRANGGRVKASFGGGCGTYVRGVMHARLADIFVLRFNCTIDKIALVLQGGCVVVHVADPRRDRGALEPDGGLYDDITHVLSEIDAAATKAWRDLQLQQHPYCNNIINRNVPVDARAG
jgi:hypothetical protein